MLVSLGGGFELAGAEVAAMLDGICECVLRSCCCLILVVYNWIDGGLDFCLIG